MLICHHCRHEFEPLGVAPTAICPECRSEVRVTAGPAWVSVVRTSNLAEAGYLADELENGGFRTQIKQHDSFSALDGSWTGFFLIQVPAEEAQQSADQLRSYLAEPELTSPLSVAQDYDATDRGPIVLRPLAMMLVAGVAILFIGQKMRELRARHDPQTRPRLLTVLEKIDRPFVSVNPRHAPNRFRLLFSRPAEAWQLQEDVDGDGHYDRHWQFQEPSFGR